VRRLCAAGTRLTLDRGRWRCRRLAFVLATATAVVVFATAPFAQIRKPHLQPVAPVMRHPPIKAIFEAMSYETSANIADVAFADDETGWICGGRSSGAGFIAATHDGGRTWLAQAGGAGSRMPSCERLFFADGTTGWATQSDGSLLRTTDGLRWTHIGAVAPHSRIVFTSHERGLAVGDGEDIHVTADGGRTWHTGPPCRVAYTLAGVAHEESCEPGAIGFAPDGTIGCVIAAVERANAAAVMRTIDSGITWTPVALLPGVDARTASVAFADSLTGYLRAGDALMMTSDGGVTWHLTDAKPPADASAVAAAGSVAWMVGRRQFSYTRDNGTRWTTRATVFPTGVNAFTVLRSGTGYVAGSGGMVYRYRVVPFDYRAPRMITIPALTTFVPPES
jgi:photosystem II stability/assembly factor-like uncharacterized protein